MKRIFTMRIDEEMLDRLRAIEARDGVRVAEQIRRAIVASLASDRRPGPREFKKGGAR